MEKAFELYDKHSTYFKNNVKYSDKWNLIFWKKITHHHVSEIKCRPKSMKVIKPMSKHEFLAHYLQHSVNRADKNNRKGLALDVNFRHFWTVLTPVISWLPEFLLSLQVELVRNTPSMASTC